MPRAVAVTVSRAGINQVLHGSTGPVHRYLERTARRVERVAKSKAPKKTGRLRSSIHVGEIVDTPRRVKISVECDVFYGIYQERGTGIYAGRGPIKAKPGKLMRFRPDNALDAAGNVRFARNGSRIGRRGGRGPSSGRGGWVYAKEVKGTPAKHFMRDALLEVCGADPRLQVRLVSR